jgi:hypothetical protein
MASYIRRRKFLATLGGAAIAGPLAARAQQPERMRRIGVLMGVADDREGQARVTALKLGLQELGWKQSIGHLSAPIVFVEAAMVHELFSALVTVRASTSKKSRGDCASPTDFPYERGRVGGQVRNNTGPDLISLQVILRTDRKCARSPICLAASLA